MNSAQRHVIKRQVIELTVQGGSARAQALREEISRIYRQRIIPLLDQRCSALCAPDRLHRIETLDLDLGRLDPHNLEDDFVAKVDVALSRALGAHIQDQEQAAKRPASSRLGANSQLELFVFFVRTGSLPWWADLSRAGLLPENLTILLEQSPAALARELKKLLPVSEARRRIINHYSDQQLTALCGLLVPACQPALKRDFLELLNGLTADNDRPAQLRQTLWSNLLMVAGLGGEQYAGLADFYRAVLKRVATELGRATLLADVHRAIQAGKITVNSRFAEIIADVTETGSGTSASNSRAQTAQPAQLPAGVDGKISGVIEMFRAKAAGLKAPEQTDLQTSDKTAIDLRFSRADEYPVTNAGLVILWPFLAHFFKHLGLLDEKQRFKDGAAQQRAVGLLHVVAAGDTSPLEYLLPLDKLLCGLDVESVFEFGPPVQEEETQECDQLLRAVIAQAPILRDMTPDGFRGSFLLRPGILGARDHMGLLRVERRTYDIVLERFPWNWQWLKLPWMESPLAVEWGYDNE